MTLSRVLERVDKYRGLSYTVFGVIISFLSALAVLFSSPRRRLAPGQLENLTTTSVEQIVPARLSVPLDGLTGIG